MGLHLQVDEEIELRYKHPQHAQLLFDLIEKNRAYLREWMSWVKTTKSIEDTLAFFKRYKGISIFEEQYPMEIWYQGKLSGMTGFNQGSKVNNHIDIGYWISQDLQGRGIVTRSVQALTKYAIENAGLNKVILKVAANN